MNNEITELNLDIELAEALTRLQKNRDFKKIVQELFLDGGSQNLTKNLVVVKDKEEIIEQIKARGYLYRFFMDIQHSGESALMTLKELQEDEEE